MIPLLINLAWTCFRIALAEVLFRPGASPSSTFQSLGPKRAILGGIYLLLAVETLRRAVIVNTYCDEDGYMRFGCLDIC